jgi:hypothetical protein
MEDYTMSTEKILCIKGNVNKGCEAADKGCFVLEGQITTSPTVAVLEIVTKVFFCPLV